ncbi:MAG: acetylxylan esterase [Planctomycetia bacterium]
MPRRSLGRRSLLRLSAAVSAGALLPAEALYAANVSSAGPWAPPDDARLGALKDLNGYFPFKVPSSLAEWKVRKEHVSRQIRVACGLWPMPERPEIKATVHGRVEREDYTVDRVYFESSPGLLVTGSLYLPKNATGRLPTILSPHGHWLNGRFHDHGDAQIEKELASGGETDKVGGRHPLQARCVQLARMGCMVFIYDMIGYADGSSLTQELAHGFAKQRPGLSSTEHFGLFSAQSELRSLNAMGLQTWNSIRALDWISSRPDCDTARIGVTGASGGGTQTFILTALDERVTAAFPAVMVSTAMQGGCTCENASYLRIETGNIEFAAMAAPRPIAMTGADDWTVDIETKGLPELKKLYAMFGVPDNVDAKYLKFPHNYNLPSRMLMYEFFNRTLNLGHSAIAEREYAPLTRDEATVFDAEHPAPDKSESAEAALLKSLDAAAAKQIAALIPQDAAGVARFRAVIGGALDVMIGRGLPRRGETSCTTLHESICGNASYITARVRHLGRKEELPAYLLRPARWNRRVVLWIDGHGKSAVFSSDGQLIPAVARLLEAGFAVHSADLYLTGEFTESGKPVAQYPTVNNPREFAGYTLGYNNPLFSQRVHDILTLTAAALTGQHAAAAVYLAGVNGAGPHVACAAAIAREQVAGVAVDTAGYRFASITDVRDVNLLPGAVRYGDLPAMLALCAPLNLAIAGETKESLPTTMAVYSACSNAPAPALLTGDSNAAISDWMIRCSAHAGTASGRPAGLLRRLLKSHH